MSGVLAVLGAVVVPAQAATTAATTAATAAATVTVNANASLGAIPGNAIGLNTAVYDGYMNDAAIPNLVKAAGITAMRYPGGSYSDIYNWQTATAPGGYVAPNTTFADFMKTAQAAGTSPVVTVNYGTGTPSLAAAWVQNATTNNDKVAYWEVGNEVYGNGTYGANWEADSRCTDASGKPVTVGSEPSQTYNCGPSVYASNLLNYISAMKAASPSSQVCAVLTTPGFWPDNVTNPTTSPQPWNQTVLTALGAKTSCVIVHYYPGGSNTASMLTDPSDITGIVSTLHSQISQYAKVDPSTVKIIVTETNSSIDLDTQPGALFAADMYLTWLENGAVNVDWWDEHNGVGTPSTVGGVQDYGDQGMFSSNSNGSGVTEPAVDTPFAPYYGVAMLSKLGTAGASLIGTTSSNSLLRTHAVRRADGSVAVLIDNEDPGNSYTVNLGYQGFTPSGGASTVYTLADNASSITSTTQSSAGSVTVAPYSLTVIQVPGSGGTGVTAPGAPGQPTVSGLTSSTGSNTSGSATLTWPAAAPGSNPIANYRVYQQNASGNTLVTTTTGTSANLSGLTIGNTYTYNVVAVDSQGNASLPSPPVTFTVPPPANAGCAVSFTVNSAWSGGYNATINIFNEGTTAINGWILTFSLPSGDGIQSGWDATWTQSGQNVSVKDAGWNGTIPPNGGSVSLGFNGTDTGSPPPPPVFYLNGSICSSIV
ncbi:MAG TPA: cellulose binding domain-containing protein [Pseudonocardiaceae bacterium]|nr:cellulose binding domain-containing protein [Pseudonocardiaceae bacterium]